MISIINLCCNLDLFNEEMIKIYSYVKRTKPDILIELQQLMKEQEDIINDVLNNLNDEEIERKRTQDMFEVLNKIQMIV